MDRTHRLSWRERLGAHLLRSYLQRLCRHYELLAVPEINPSGPIAAERCAGILDGLRLAGQPCPHAGAGITRRRS